MERLRIIFIDSILLFLSCIVEIISYLKNKFKGIILPKKNIIEAKKILEERNNYPGTGYICGSVNISSINEIDKERILQARLSKFSQNANSSNLEKQKKLGNLLTINISENNYTNKNIICQIKKVNKF
uniref:Uncharacterized protein n=1 Tax=Moumouvirus sp. 'Monve' TaxID=1128131 RepID=H2EDS8_9VIRU|nr:hypothetical protein mv_L346 [Moumouvirus Monve]